MSVLKLYIGRFSPVHRGHTEVIKRALQTSDKLLVLIGSTHQARTIKNPFTYVERSEMIYNYVNQSTTLYKVPANKLVIDFLFDIPYNDQLWLQQVQEKVNKVLATMPADTEVLITGSDRDSSSYYLKLFPNYKLDLVDEVLEVSKFLSATTVRDIYFGRKFSDKIMLPGEVDVLLRSFVPSSSLRFLKEFEKTEDFAQLSREYDFIRKYKKAWEAAPYAPIFMTVDSVVVQSGHVLLVQRKHEPGKGLWALPGGFVEQSEKLLDSAVRELREETRLKVPTPVLKGSMIKKEIFDLPDRSLRGRTITVAYLFKLAETGELPVVKGSDDAEKAEWIPLGQIQNMRSLMFEDHFSILETLISGSM